MEWCDSLIALRSHTHLDEKCESCGTTVALRETVTDNLGVPFPGDPDLDARIAELAAVRLASPTRREWVELVPVRDPVFNHVGVAPVPHTPERCRAARATSAQDR